MKYSSFFIVSFIAVAMIARTISAADKIAPAAAKSAEIAESNISRQLRIIKAALLNGPTRQNREDAAVELIVRPEQQSREIVLETLGRQENSPARRAVCKALSDSRLPIANKMDFLAPLLGILLEKDGQDAKYAAEATLIFEYDQIAPQLNKIVSTIENERLVRLNALYALQLRPVEKTAVSAIANLLDDPDKQVAKAAHKAIPYWIPAGLNRPQIQKYLQNKNQREIIRVWTEFQDKELRRLETEKKKWQKLYLASLNKDFEAADDAAKGIILIDTLSSDLAAVRLWGLDKVAVLSPSVILPAEFNSSLLGLISDPDRNVRLKTAEVLSIMSDRNPAEKLLAQFKVEEYDDVKLELFKALGEACYFAFSPGSTIKLPEGMRSQTLIIAEQYINHYDTEKAVAGAEVIRKLLEPVGLEEQLVDKYLKLIIARFNRAKETNPALAADILDVMARISSQATNRDMSARLFRPYFRQSLTEKDSRLRQTAVAGLIDIDKTSALEVFIKNKLKDDPSESIRLAVIELTGQTGKAEDIAWLIKRTTVNGNGPAAWNSIEQILQRQQSDVINKWANRLIAAKISNERLTAILEIAEKKALAEKNNPVLKSVRNKLNPIHLEAFLKISDPVKTGELIAKVLKQGDLAPGNVLTEKLSVYFDSDAAKEQKLAILEELTKVTKAANVVNIPQWQTQLNIWKQTVKPPHAPTRESKTKPEKPAAPPKDQSAEG